MVRVSHMPFAEAWPKRLHFALFGGGPHISIIRAIWTSSLYPRVKLWVRIINNLRAGHFFDSHLAMASACESQN